MSTGIESDPVGFFGWVRFSDGFGQSCTQIYTYIKLESLLNKKKKKKKKKKSHFESVSQ